jgi:hypothetical protein
MWLTSRAAEGRAGSKGKKKVKAKGGKAKGGKKAPAKQKKQPQQQQQGGDEAEAGQVVAPKPAPAKGDAAAESTAEPSDAQKPGDNGAASASKDASSGGGGDAAAGGDGDGGADDGLGGGDASEAESGKAGGDGGASEPETDKDADGDADADEEKKTGDEAAPPDSARASQPQSGDSQGANAGSTAPPQALTQQSSADSTENKTDGAGAANGDGAPAAAAAAELQHAGTEDNLLAPASGGAKEEKKEDVSVSENEKQRMRMAQSAASRESRERRRKALAEKMAELSVETLDEDFDVQPDPDFKPYVPKTELKRRQQEAERLARMQAHLKPLPPKLQGLLEVLQRAYPLDEGRFQTNIEAHRRRFQKWVDANKLRTHEVGEAIAELFHATLVDDPLFQPPPQQPRRVQVEKGQYGTYSQTKQRLDEVETEIREAKEAFWKQLKIASREAYIQGKADASARRGLPFDKEGELRKLAALKASSSTASFDGVSRSESRQSAAPLVSRSGARGDRPIDAADRDDYDDLQVDDV